MAGAMPNAASMGHLGEASLNPSQGASVVKANNATIAKAGEQRRNSVQDVGDSGNLRSGSGDGGGGSAADGGDNRSSDGVHCFSLRWEIIDEFISWPGHDRGRLRSRSKFRT